MEEEGCLVVEVSFIPKNMGASDAKDYRPINLIGSVYKIVAKVLAKRLVPQGSYVSWISKKCKIMLARSFFYTC